MAELHELSNQELIAKIEELQALLAEKEEEKDSLEPISFPWAGNLGNWYWYIKENRVIFNDLKVQALGYAREEIPENIGFEFFTERLHPDDYERVMDNMRSHLHGKSPAYETSYRIRTRNGEWVWFYDRGVITKRGAEGQPEQLSGIVFDITEQKRMEALLEEQNRQLLEMSTTDYLTKVFNRRALLEKLEFELMRASRISRPLCVLIMDIDHFKQINDTYGHLLGDKILVRLAETVKTMIRKIDIFGRYGGEEFLVILPECALNDGAAIAERIRAGIQETAFPSGIKVTVSGGLAEFRGESIEQLIDCADQFLYQAKNSGRNRIACR